MYSKIQASQALFTPKSKYSINQNVISKSLEELKQMQDLLNSQRIELLFGNYEVEILLQEGNHRVSNLKANEIMQTCAVVSFALPVPDWLQTTHDTIYSGGSIGQTIKNNGFNLIKEDVFLSSSELPVFARERMNTEENLAAIHMYQLTVIQPETLEKINYCTITELHNPLYLTLGDLVQLSPEKMPLHELTEEVQKNLSELKKLDSLFSSLPKIKVSNLN